NHAAVVFTETVSGPLRSTDGGATWQPILVGLGLTVQSLAFDPFTPGKLYIVGQRGGAASTDDGVSWLGLGRVDATGQPTVIVADPKRQGVLYAEAQGGLWKSSDGGARWSTLSGVPRYPGLAADPVTGAIYAVIDQHVEVTND